MAQFDVYVNPGRQRATIPYVVVLQSARFDRSATRFVAPLILRSAVQTEEHYLAPCFAIEGQDVVMDVFNLATLPANRLGQCVVSLTDDLSRSKLIRALDELISQA